MSASPIILASASPRRSTLLREAGFDFKVVVPVVSELQPAHLSPHEICQVNAYRKAWAVAKHHPDAVIIGADTLVFLDMKVYGKPSSMAEAVQMLEELQGRIHHVVSGVCLIHLRRHRQHVFADSTAVRFKPLSPEGIADYLKVVNPLDKAGAYGIQEHGTRIVESIDGSYSNVVGIPMERLRHALAAFNAPSPPDA
jgi:septum formation protein